MNYIIIIIMSFIVWILRLIWKDKCINDFKIRVEVLNNAGNETFTEF